MREVGVGKLVCAAVVAAALALPCLASAAPTPGPYGADDAGGFLNILPPGQGQSVNAAQIGAFLAGGTRPPHDSDQLQMYEDLVYATPGLKASQLTNFYKDATFGVETANVERTYSPRADVTIVRDQFGVPRIYGETRAGAMFGAGYIAAEDRMFFIDALRHAGRAQLAAFAGGSAGNRRMDQSVWADTPYRNDQELQVQYDLADEAYGRAGAQVAEDVSSFVDGINHRIAEIRANPLLMPGEYPLLGHPAGPEDWKVTDVISIASLVAGIFGKGGGNEVNSALVLEAAQKRFGKRAGLAAWKDFRRANDPEAPTTVHDQRFPYMPVPRNAAAAMPDPGTVRPQEVVASSTASAETTSGSAGGELRDIGDLLGNLSSMQGASNALLVSKSESKGGAPIAVFGPQVSYYTPQILMEFEIHAPGGPTGPPLDARGAAFPGTNLYVQLGHGRDYAWSATSAGQDIVDTFAVKLCNADGSKPTIDSMGYRFHGRCLPVDVLERVDSWTASPGDTTPSGSDTLRAERTALGIVTHRALIDGKPVAFTKLRATYYHEVDSALGFADFNNPKKMQSPQEFMKAACRIQYTFNWFFINHQHIAYFNSGINPVRSSLAHPDLPTPGAKKYEWRGYVPPSQGMLSGAPIDQTNVSPRTNFSEQEPCDAHPQVVDQPYVTSWNNKQAPGMRAADDNYAYGPVFRSGMLDDRLQKRIAGKRKMTRPKLVDSMEDAGTDDLRGDVALPYALDLIGKAGNTQVKQAVKTLRAWMRTGNHRRDKDANGVYDDAEAVRIMDAWWPRWVAAEFKPELGGKMFGAVETMIGLHDAPGPIGSSFISGWYGYVNKDLRALLGFHVKGKFSRVYCGGGSLSKCRRALVSSLADALQHTSDAELYPDGPCEGGDAQWCHDAVRHTATGAISQPPIHWINRPTFQQVVQVR
jgi:acyl-homoserine lactone acylase PvdQ